MERYTKFPFNCQWSIDPTEGRKLLQIQWSLKFPNSLLSFPTYIMQLTLIHEFRGSNSGRDKRPFCSPKLPERLWSPSNLLCNGYQGSLPE